MKMNDSHYRLAEILEKADQEEILDKGEIVFLLGLTQKNQIDAVFEAARELRFLCATAGRPPKLLRQRKAWLNPVFT
jgi:hypothetical protein